MTATTNETLINRLFPVNWAGFNPIAGVKLFVFALVAGLITVFTDLNLVVVIIGALLAWLTDIPGTTKNRVAGMAIYGVVASVWIWLATTILTDVIWFTVAMFLVAFVSTLPMAISSRGYMVGWGTLITFIQANNMTGSGEPSSTIMNLLFGVGLVILLTVLWPKGTGPWGSSGDDPPPESGGADDRVFVLVYALTVATVLALAAYLGQTLFTFGVQMIATSTFMVLGPTTQQNWGSAAGRAVAVVVGIALAYLLVTSIDSLPVLTIVWAIFPAIAVSTLGVSYAIAIGAYTTQMMMVIVLLGGDLEAYNLDSSTRIISEAIGIALALGAALFLQWWTKRREVKSFANAEFSEAEFATS
jgi:hypothetical protein